jgi:DNA-directed RNA polymerase subunit RPC12/RpoP
MSLRDLILGLMSPKMKADAEAESRTWVATCPRCLAESSVWDMGGVRYKAYGAKITLVRCTNCGKRSFMRLRQKA